MPKLCFMEAQSLKYHRASLITQVPNIKFQTMAKSQMLNDQKNELFCVWFFIIGICLLFTICDLEFLETLHTSLS
jgi:hypothetical protein